VLLGGGLSLLSLRSSAQRIDARIHPNARRDFVAILMWHDVVDGRKDVWFDTTVKEFEAQLAAIRRMRLNVISLEQVSQNLLEGSPVPPRSIVLTFDDNTKGIWKYAYPRMKAMGMHSTHFVHTDFVGVTTVKEHCTWEELKAMQDSGLVSVQGHTRSHPRDMRELSDAGLVKELTESKVRLEQKLGKPVFAFAYTEGKYNLRVAAATLKAGYRIALTENFGSAGSSVNRMEVHRYSIHKRFDQALRDVDRFYRGRG
jgi:peptidoglycan/xylan/chitin deacetylase (PgdA/CDA1 family)